jgi:hypothetical protein
VIYSKIIVYFILSAGDSVPDGYLGGDPGATGFESRIETFRGG